MLGPARISVACIANSQGGRRLRGVALHMMDGGLIDDLFEELARMLLARRAWRLAEEEG